MAVLDSWGDSQKAQALSRLDTIPKRTREAGAGGTSLRHRTDWLASQYIKTVSMSLRVKAVGAKPKINSKKLLWKAVKRTNIIRELSQIPKNVQAETAKEVAPKKTKAQVAKEGQEHVLRQDLHRLTAIANQACEEARCEQAYLRGCADELRMKVKALEDGESVTQSPQLQAFDDSTSSIANSCLNGEGEPPEIKDLRQQNISLERRVQALRAKLDQAYEQRDDLLNELRNAGTGILWS